MTSSNRFSRGLIWHRPRRLPVPTLETLALAVAMLAMSLATCWFVAALPEIVVMK